MNNSYVFFYPVLILASWKQSWFAVGVILKCLATKNSRSSSSEDRPSHDGSSYSVSAVQFRTCSTV